MQPWFGNWEEWQQSHAENHWQHSAEQNGTPLTSGKRGDVFFPPAQPAQAQLEGEACQQQQQNQQYDFQPARCHEQPFPNPTGYNT